MNRIQMLLGLGLAVGAVTVAGLVSKPGREVQVFVVPLYAQMQTQEEPPDTTWKRAAAEPRDTVVALPWLRVEVETSYGWFWQKSVGRAYTTQGQDSTVRVPVGKLCLRLVSHDTTEKCLANVDSLVIEERKRGIGIPKRTAYVSAWTDIAGMDTLHVQMAP